MMTSSNGNIFRVTRRWPVTGEFPAQRPVTRIFVVFFDLRLNKRLNKQWWSRWFEAPSRPWCHGIVVSFRVHNKSCNGCMCVYIELYHRLMITSWHGNDIATGLVLRAIHRFPGLILLQKASNAYLWSVLLIAWTWTKFTVVIGMVIGPIVIAVVIIIHVSVVVLIVCITIAIVIVNFMKTVIIINQYH